MFNVFSFFFLLLLPSVAQTEPLQNEPILPLPKNIKELDIEKTQLGYLLFNEKKLSKDNTISCASCHNLDHGGSDNKPKSIGIKGAEGDINTPTVFNSALNFRQFWNGRANSLEEQIEGPVQHPKEMGSTWDEVVEKLKKNQVYIEFFKRVYDSKINKENIKNAIATFEKALITPNSRFDRYLSGEKDILTDSELRGYQLFKSYGCVSCHQGANVGGNMFQTMGVMGKYFEDRKQKITDADLGRFNVTKDDKDKFLFRVPSLRNVELTAPYFHDGSAAKLEEAVAVMAKYQLGRKLTIEEINLIVEFLKTLTGQKPRVLMEKSIKETRS